MKKLLLFIILLTSLTSIAQVNVKSKNELLTIYVDSTISTSNSIKVHLFEINGKKIKETSVHVTDTINNVKIYSIPVKAQSKGVFILNLVIDDKTFKRLYINE